MLVAAMFILGLLAWTLIEYTIHGFLSHIFDTPVTRLHAVHHRDPHAVFTAGAWAPIAIVSAIIFAVFGLNLATAAWLGIVTGFLGYELFHYRFHFSVPLCAFEDRMRTRHLAHHHRAPELIFGVTNDWWDRAFGSEPEAGRLGEMRASFAMTPPLSGRSNLCLVVRPWVFVARRRPMFEHEEASSRGRIL